MRNLARLVWWRSESLAQLRFDRTKGGFFYLVELNRTAGIDMADLRNVSGSSYTNEDAASTDRRDH